MKVSKVCPAGALTEKGKGVSEMVKTEFLRISSELHAKALRNRSKTALHELRIGFKNSVTSLKTSCRSKNGTGEKISRTFRMC